MMKPGQQGMCCILHGRSSHRGLLNEKEHLFPYVRGALALESWMGLGPQSGFLAVLNQIKVHTTVAAEFSQMCVEIRARVSKSWPSPAAYPQGLLIRGALGLQPGHSTERIITNSP